ncbi:zinc dependent phospholipase C family protein [Acidaminobacterium chupaoyuni]
MLPLPHIRIANHVRRVLESRYSYKVSAFPFVLGSIYPDFTYKTFHYKHNILDALREARLFSRIAAEAGSFRRSFQLGVICHYTADSFCDAHIMPQNYSKIQHLLYEIRQSRAFRRGLTDAEKSAMNSGDPFKSKDLHGFIRRYRDFLSRRHSYKEECDAAVQGSVSLLKSLLKAIPGGKTAQVC